MKKEDKRDQKAIDKDKKVLKNFVEVYCDKNHTGKRGALCDQCKDLLEYGTAKLEKCPYNPKPKCKHCQTHCYEPEMRKRVREVMKFSGRYYAKRGRIDWLIKYFT